MQPVSGKDAAARLTGIISPKHQVHAFSVDLTVAKVYALDPTGQVDFGGNEYAPATHTALASHRRRTEDNYEWWDLGRGCYTVEFNEGMKLADDEIAVLEPDDRLLRAGASHTTSWIRGQAAQLETLLFVGALNMLVKQNARIGRLRVFRFDSGAAHAGAAKPPASSKSHAKKAAAKKSPKR
jgi:deoxycytidine triphosphate deaminase